MKELLKGKRAFSREIEDKEYLILPATEFSEAMYFSYMTLIKKGDMPYPDRWIDYQSQDERSGLIPLEDFNEDDYEYIFMKEKLMENRLDENLNPYGITVGTDLKNLFEIAEISDEIQQVIKDVLDEWNLIGELQLERCEILHYSDGDSSEFVRIQHECSTHDIDYDETDYLTDQTITETYKRKLETHTEYLHKTNENRWFIEKPSIEPFALFVIEEIWDIEDMIPFTTFKPA
ncbi:hypothetical protein [Bacillus toyonensis]|uniref:hypothetical protein n=1 Tax=Bacillus toyonensis TaxID=155322 RepID=UPI000BFBAA4E|nr:hypothetical protein [Bacillus toyonensis]PHF07213.1 hypothetical protein COF83_30975 [Bacillus toyonensis]PHF43010.1 hypothetical protein COI39_20260 [Bacillus toyonensis]